MNEIVPIKLVPAYKDYLWGGDKLRSVYGKETEISPIAESWELSCHKDGLSIISGGVYDGKTLEKYISDNPECLGTLRKTDELPILIKLIDAQDNLSIQVHPKDEQAREWEKQNGKTEMWYILDADEDAKIVYGVKESISKEELKEAILNNTVEELLDSTPSKKGDVFFVEAGTIHAIGKGNLIAEIQQNSNVTYRLYDYDRRDKNGNARELHIEKGVEASNTQRTEKKKMPYCSDGTRLIGSCENFEVKELTVNGIAENKCDERSYQSLLVVDGELEFAYKEQPYKMNVGKSIFLPAGLGKYTLKGTGKVLVTQNSPIAKNDVI